MTNLIFFGSDQYSAIVLDALITAKTPIFMVITDRAKPVGRDQIVEPNPVEKLSITHDLKVSYYPPNIDILNNKDVVGLCASFDHLLPAEIIDLFHGNLYNLHPSLLPQYRNVSPVQYAIALGDTETGITLFRISAGIDNGEILAQSTEPILLSDTTPTLSARLFHLGAELFLQFIQGTVLCKPIQKNKEPSLVFTRRLTRDSGFVEWEVFEKLIANKPITKSVTTNALIQLQSEPSLDHLLRALTPWPGVWTVAPTKKGDLRLSLVSMIPTVTIKLAGKPNPILYSEFAKYYLD